jgi:gamma-glutamyltranspeptidase/glutathione hydrolase
MNLRRTLAVLVCLLPGSVALAGSQAIGTRAAIATSSRHATNSGLDVLRRGGNAADAAVAVAFTLAVVKPEAAGIGGGGALIYYDAKNDAVWTLDFRENAPASLAGAGPRSGAAAAGVPSTVAGMAELHRRFATMPWKELLAPAMRGAKDDLAITLTTLANEGGGALYTGAMANRIVEAVKKGGGTLSLFDMSQYRPAWRAPIRITFGGDRIDSLPPPSAGGTMIAQILGILGGTALKDGDAASLHMLMEAERRAAFDRDRYFNDIGGVRYQQLLTEENAKQWRAGIDPNRATPTSTLGTPAKTIAQSIHTSHFTIVDAAGNIAAVTTTLGDLNGSGFEVAGSGIVLNDAARDAVRGGDRVPSSLTPAIVFRGGKPLLALGSAGGVMTPSVVLQVILNVTRFGKSIGDALESPRFDQQATPDDISYERTRTAPALLTRFHAMGHGARAHESIGEVNAVLIESGRLTAVSDPRSSGVAGAM